jgi:hypothetical protein
MSPFKWFVVFTAAFFALGLFRNVGARVRRVREADNRQARFKRALVGMGTTIFELTLYVLAIAFLWWASSQELSG